MPDENGYQPNYGDYRFEFGERENRWLPIAKEYGNKNSGAPISMHADVNVYAAALTGGKPVNFKAGEGRQAYLVLIEGQADINGISLNMRDGLEIVEEDISITPKDSAHLLVIEMKKA
jgi:redox-sensitive bicupin YhaK (pirin superfamily)